MANPNAKTVHDRLNEAMRLALEARVELTTALGQHVMNNIDEETLTRELREAAKRASKLVNAIEASRALSNQTH